MASSRANEFRFKLEQWKEELRTCGDKTEITKRDIGELSDLICAVENAENALSEAEEAVIECLWPLTINF